MDVDETQTPLLPVELQTLSTLLEQSPETLASGSQEIQYAAIQAAKHIFDLSVKSESSSSPHIDELLESLAPSQAPQTRSKARAQAQKSVDNDAKKALFKPTPITSLYVDGMGYEQVWAQLDLRTANICRMLDFVLEGVAEGGDEEELLEESDDEPSMDEDTELKLRAAIQAYQDGEQDGDLNDLLAKFGLIGDGDEDMEGDWDDEDDLDMSGDDGEALEDDEDEEGEEEEGGEDLSPLRDHELEQGNRKKPLVLPSRKQKGKSPISELDDGFFNLAEFNADTERAEAKYSTKGRLSGDDSDEEDVEVDLFANIDLNGNDEDNMDGDGEALYYRDFFEPPPRSTVAGPSSMEANKKTQVRFHEQVRVKKIKATGKNRSLHDDSDDEDDGDEDSFGEEGQDKFDFEGEDDEGFEDELEEDEDEEDGKSEDDGEDDEDVDEDQSEGTSEHSDEAEDQRSTINRLKQDLFADDDEEPDDDMTTHERRMTSLKEEIAELEAENVAPKEWTLMGEAGSRSRPQNSLLEEDLEFERVMKAVPVTTEESVKSLEETIKARILENRFDDVIRIRALEDKPFLPSKFFELNDKKSSQSLAQIYENDYVASQAGGSLPDDRDGKLAKEHEEINALWENICGKLDALCNAHFVPKQPKATISTVSNTATATLESALPTTKSTSTMLAPEEVFAASGPSRARSELTPVEKRAQRSKDRKQRKRQRDYLERGVDKFAKAAKSIGGVKKQKQAALDSIVKHGKGVTVVGKQSAATSKKNNKNILPLDILAAMNFFKKKNNETIPPVSAPTIAQTPSNSSSQPRGSANTYVASRDGDPYNASANSGSNSRKVYNNPNNVEYANDYSDKYNRNRGVGDVYSRGGGDVSTDRNELFSGYNPEKSAGSGRFFDGPSSGPAPSVGEETEEDVEGIKRQTRWTKQESVNSTRNALRMAREAEETARNTLGRLGDQSEKLADTERHLDVAKGHSQRADDKTNELKQLNRSIFRPAITFNKDAKRAAQEAKMQARYEEEREEREKTMTDIRETQNRIGRAQTYGRPDNNEELLGRGNQRSAAAQAARKEQRQRYQFDATASDDEIEDELDDNLDEIGDAAKRLKALGMAMGGELDKQMERIQRIEGKAVDVDGRLYNNTERLKRIK